jgi:DNA repair exonuclease SbcCD ATPase subunit
MFSYASGNEINFENFVGTYGLFAANASGKSALLDAMCFCLFDRCSRTASANDVMNNKKNDFSCKLQYRIDGQDYFIERKAHRVLKGYHSGKVTVKVNFWTIDNGQEVSLNGEQRYDTNKNIRNHVGSYDDFILTTLSVQNNNTAFIEKSQSERKDLLAQFLDISVFEELYNLANNEIKGVSAILDEFKKTDFTQQLADADTEIEKNKNLNIEVRKEKASAANKLKTLEKRITKKEASLSQIGHVNEDINGLKFNLDREESKVRDATERLKKDEETSRKNKEILAATNILLSKLGDIEKIKNGNEKYLEAEKSHDKILNEIEKIKIIVKNKLEKLKHLDKHEYDPDCKYCVNNPFVQDAKATEAELETDKIKVKRLFNNIEVSKDQMVDNKKYFDILSKVENYNLTIQTIETERNEGRIEYYKAKEKLGRTENSIEQIKNDISKYHQNKKDIIHNQKINDVLNELSNNKIILEAELEVKENELLTIYGSLEVALNTKKTILDSIKRAESLQDKYKAYEYYLDAIQRDGVPYELISKIIPIVEDEVNDILNRIVEFNIIFNLDGKNINTYITYGDDKVWPLELTSGMEKFISSIAIRTALINISNLSRPNFLAIDEGLGNLDSENLNSMFMLFEYLKSQFEFLLVISHLESVRDVVDNLIDIKKESGFSKVIY